MSSFYGKTLLSGLEWIQTKFFTGPFGRKVVLIATTTSILEQVAPYAVAVGPPINQSLTGSYHS